MKQTVVAVLFCQAFASSFASIPALAQNSIAGSWQLDLARSDARRNGPPLLESSMVVTLNGEDVEVHREFPRGSYSVTYITDGKPHTIESPLGSQKVRAKWKKDKLGLSYTISRGRFEIDVNETWAIKKGELTIAYATRVGERPSVRKEIYTPAE